MSFMTALPDWHDGSANQLMLPRSPSWWRTAPVAQPLHLYVSRRAHLALFFLVFAVLSGLAQPSAQLRELLNRASILSRDGDYAHAISLLRKALVLAPRDAQANYLLGIALLESGHPADALSPLGIAAESDPSNTAASGYLGDAHMELKQFASAAETFQRAMARSPASEQSLGWWTEFALERYRELMFSLRASDHGRAALLQVAAEDTADLKSALSLFAQAAALDPQLDGIWAGLGIAQARLQMNAEAATSLAKARASRPDAASTLELESLVDAGGGDWRNAESRIRDLSHRSPGAFHKFAAAWPHTLLPGGADTSPEAECLRKLSACPSALSPPPSAGNVPVQRLFWESRWEELAALSPPPSDDGEAWFHRGMAFVHLGSCGLAIPALERGLFFGAERDASRLAVCYQSAAEHAADQLRAMGKEAAVHKIRGDILLSIRMDPAQAISEYNKALQLSPNDPEVLEKLADAQFSVGEMDRARQDAESALRQAPHRTQLLRLLVRIAISDRDYTNALALLDKLAALQPDEPWIRVEQGTAYAETGRPLEAVQHLEPALDAGYSDERGALHAMLAAQLRKLGRDRDAQQASDEAIRLADSYQQQKRAAAPDLR